MWIMIVVLMNMMTGEVNIYVPPSPVIYTTKAECMASFTDDPVAWKMYTMRAKCIAPNAKGI